jgi:hypothetical protein
MLFVLFYVFITDISQVLGTIQSFYIGNGLQWS